MGLTRKMMSASTLGAVHYRNSGERTEHYSKKTAKAAKAQATAARQVSAAEAGYYAQQAAQVRQHQAWEQQQALQQQQAWAQYQEQERREEWNRWAAQQPVTCAYCRHQSPAGSARCAQCGSPEVAFRYEAPVAEPATFSERVDKAIADRLSRKRR